MDSCRMCGKHKLLPLLDFGKHPIAHHFLTDQFQDEYVHPVTVCFCEGCGLIQLVNPVPLEMLYTEYVTLSSWKHQPHTPRLVQMIEQLPGLENASWVVEVGSNDGTFLEVLRERGYLKVLGVEPAQDAQEVARQKGLETVGAYFTPEVARELVSTSGRCDLLVGRHVVEHITDLKAFLEAMQMLLRPGGYVLIEVPNFEFCLTAPDYSGIWEEHVNYFTLETLSRFLADAGIRIIQSERMNFSGETLIVLGEYIERPFPPPSQGYLEQLRAKALAYRDRWPVFRHAFIQYLREYRKNGHRVAVYGAGCRACSLINFAGLGPHLDFVVDDQPEKQGKYMAASRLPILPGEALEEHSVALCLLAVNAENERRVIAKHQIYLEKGGCFASVLPPSDLLLPFWSQV